MAVVRGNAASAIRSRWHTQRASTVRQQLSEAPLPLGRVLARKPQVQSIGTMAQEGRDTAPVVGRTTTGDLPADTYPMLLMHVDSQTRSCPPSLRPCKARKDD